MGAFQHNQPGQQELGQTMDRALQETIQAFEATGSPVITNGEPSKPSFATYPIAGRKGLLPNGVLISFAHRHTRDIAFAQIKARIEGTALAEKTGLIHNACRHPYYR